ncbi:TonB-dependent receptor family protein [Segetibacter koreensis]|uniref:TonB-dependent receptor family protein n=1 Tax=Segetibacter koreensis TaxID=398037 RepID=UPI00036C69F1|nr:TonB-dependent receptor family protein [Segetibacter koreensis]
MKKLLLTFSLLISVAIMAQMPQGRGSFKGGKNQNFNVGHLYGKVVDSKTGKGIDGASLQLLGNRFDSTSGQMISSTLKAAITNSKGEFDLDNLPVRGNSILKFSAVGYKPIEQKISFGVKMPQGGDQGENAREQMMSMMDKDLGNIKLQPDAAVLANVTVTSTKELFEMGVDRKIFNVDKNLTSQGQTATEIMKSIPSLSVDIDGNVTMRNATPTLFVDGRPTTLTMDQIPADIIEKVELITNPSAKFDASGGNAGILNIVLKKNRKVGYNGGIRVGADTRGRVNLGGDINFRQNKINFFASGNLNQRKSKSTATTDRTNLSNGVPVSRVYQRSNPISTGYFGFIRGGFDYLIDNRNTLTLSGNYNKGSFNSSDNQHVDSSLIINPSFNTVNQTSDRNFQNLGSQLSYKHNFAKNGHELTADANYNSSKNDNVNFINTQTYDLASTVKGLPVMQQSTGGGNSKNYTFQSDYENPFSDNQKIEAGVRAAIRDFENNNNQYFFNHALSKYVLSQRISSNYKFTDKVYAAYGTYSLKLKKWSYQFGLRVESSSYDGSIIGKDILGRDSLSSFKVDFPLSLFPSAFITYKISDKEDFQMNYSRRINRPNFWQLIPFTDYSDPYNLSVGNAQLKPEFTNSFEVSYNNNYKKGANFLVSGFFKYNTNLITRYQYLGANPDTAHHYSASDSVLFNTYLNANNSFTYGLELTNRIPVTRWWDMTANFNLFNSRINLSDPKQSSLTNQRTSWFAKLNNSVKFPKKISLQLSGEYYAKTVLPQGGGGGRGGFGGGPVATAQGYINPRYSFDIALRKDWTWKGGNSASLTVSMNDFLRTQLYSTYSESPFLMQTSERRRDPQILRVNFAYRFGKFDVNLFKRKNNKEEQGGNDIIPVQ